MKQQSAPMTVYHRDPLYTGSISSRFAPNKEIGWPVMYKAVAIVPGENLGQAYAATQSIDAPWWQAYNIQKLTPCPCRSTSVGDVIRWGRSFWAVADIGFALVLRLQRGDVVDAYSRGDRTGTCHLGKALVLSSTQTGVYIVGAGLTWARLATPTNDLELRFVRRVGLHQKDCLIKLAQELEQEQS